MSRAVLPGLIGIGGGGMAMFQAAGAFGQFTGCKADPERGG